MIRSLPFILLVLVNSSLLAQQQNISLDGSSWLSKVTPLPSSAALSNRGIVATYDLTWKGKIRAGSATVVLGSTNQSVVAGSVKGKSSGLAGSLFPYNFTYTSRFSKGNQVTPISSSLQESTRKVYSTCNVSFQQAATISNRSITEKKSSSKTTKDKAYRLANNPIQCVFSSLVNYRSQPLHKGQQITTLVFPKDRPYLLQFTVLGREKRNVKGTNHDTIKMDLKILGKVNNDKSLKTYDKVKTCTVWLKDDADRLPLELRAELFVGHMTVYQTSLKYTN